MAVAVTPGFSGTLGLDVQAGAICDSLDQLDPAMFSLVQSLFVSSPELTPLPLIDRADMIDILGSAAADGGVTDDALAALEKLVTRQPNEMNRG